MAPFDRRDFSGNSVPTTTTGSIDNDDLTINISSSTGWPDGDVGPFIVTMDKGLSTEEKIEVASRTGLVLTVTPTGRGHDNTAASSHGAGSPIEHTMAARDLAEANQHIADDSQDHHSQYLNSVRHAAENHAISTGEIDNEAVTYAKLAQGQRHEPGDFKWSIQAASHTGWLLCNGATVLIADYPALWAAMGSAHIFGTDPGGAGFRLPDLRKKYLAGKSAAGVGSTLGGTFGSADAVVVTHSHQINNHTHAFTSGDVSQGHTHAAENHNHWVNASGTHDHAAGGTGGDKGYRFLITAVGTNEKIAGGSTPGIIGSMVPTDIEPDGNHDHGWSGGHANHSGGQQGQSQGHTHSGTTGNPSNLGTDNGSGNVSGVDQNLPPSIAVNGFIHT